MDPNHIPTTITATEDQNLKTTIEEPDQANDMGIGRSYECIYCKRGFTTAQALGGHMNIHRKDRVKTKSNATNHPSKPKHLSHHPLPPSTTTTLISTSHHQSFQTYFPTSSTTPPYDHNNPIENWKNISLASPSPNPNLIDLHDKRSDSNDNVDDDDNNEELDLELRLGHDR